MEGKQVDGEDHWRWRHQSRLQELGEGLGTTGGGGQVQFFVSTFRTHRTGELNKGGVRGVAKRGGDRGSTGRTVAGCKRKVTEGMGSKGEKKRTLDDQG